jgi:hypothetical protein
MAVVKFPTKDRAELDLESLRLKPEDVAAMVEAKAQKPRPARDKDFLHETMIRLAIGLNAGGGTVWAYLLQQARMKGKEAIPVPNLALSRLGVSRFAKGRALERLEATGLVRMDRRPGRSPRATVLI